MSAFPPAELEPGVVLRPASLDDAEAWARHVAADLGHLGRHLGWPARTTTAEGAAAFIGPYVRRESGRELLLVLERGGELLGGTVLMAHDPAIGSVELGCWVVAPAEGRGLVRRSCLATLRHARGVLGAHRVVWTAAVGNTRSGALARRLGFRSEGVMRDAGLLDGVRQDLERFSLVGAEVDAALA